MTGPAILRNDDPSAANLPVRLRLQAQLSASETAGLNPSTVLVLLGMYRAMAVLDRNQTDELAPSGLNSAQFNVLTVLHRVAAPLAMRQLSTMMAVQPTNLSGIVRALRGRGFVKQVLNEADSRSLLVSITPQGEKFLAAMLPTHWERLEGIMASLSEDERQTLVALLERLVHSIRVAERDKTEGTSPDGHAAPQAETQKKTAGKTTIKSAAPVASTTRSRSAPTESVGAKRVAAPVRRVRKSV